MERRIEEEEKQGEYIEIMEGIIAGIKEEISRRTRLIVVISVLTIVVGIIGYVKNSWWIMALAILGMLVNIIMAVNVRMIEKEKEEVETSKEMLEMLKDK